VPPRRRRPAAVPARLRDDPGGRRAPRPQSPAVPVPPRSAGRGDPEPRPHRSLRPPALAVPRRVPRPGPVHRAHGRADQDPALRLGTPAGGGRALENRAAAQEARGCARGRAAVQDRGRRMHPRPLRRRALRPAARAGRRRARDVREGRPHPGGGDRPPGAAGGRRGDHAHVFGRPGGHGLAPRRRPRGRSAVRPPADRIDLRRPAATGGAGQG